MAVILAELISVLWLDRWGDDHEFGCQDDRLAVGLLDGCAVMAMVDRSYETIVVQLFG